MIRLVAETDPLNLAWQEFDAAAIGLQRMYVDAGREESLPDPDRTRREQARRAGAALRTSQLWAKWQTFTTGLPERDKLCWRLIAAAAVAA